MKVRVLGSQEMVELEYGHKIIFDIIKYRDTVIKASGIVEDFIEDENLIEINGDWYNLSDIQIVGIRRAPETRIRD